MSSVTWCTFLRIYTCNSLQSVDSKLQPAPDRWLTAFTPLSQVPGGAERDEQRAAACNMLHVPAGDLQGISG